MDLIDELEQRRKGMSWFRKVALHVHSPASHDWPKDSKDLLDRKEALLQDPSPYLKCVHSTYQLVAITDHMHASFACDQCQGTGSCVVLPGMEVAVQQKAPLSAMRVHFLVIFPEGSAADLFERVFEGQTHLPTKDQRTGKEELRFDNIKELAERVHKNGGLLVAAHVEGDAGYRAYFKHVGHGVLHLLSDHKEFDERARELCEDFKSHLIDVGVDAVEIHKPEHAGHYRFRLGDREVEVATVLRNDAHNLNALEGGVCTYVKMAEVGYRGLEQALRFPDTRIRHEPPEAPAPVLEGIRIADSKGCFSDTTIALSPNLSCIIGARGTGKSALVDAVRYTFGHNRTIGAHIGKELAEQVTGRQSATVDGATIEIVYRTAAGKSFRLISSYSKKEEHGYNTRVFDQEHRDTGIADVEKHPDFPCRLHGWGEVEMLGREPAGQRKLLDVVLDLHEMIAERDALVSQLTTEGMLIEATATELDNLHEQSKYLSRLEELRKEDAVLKSPAMDELFRRADEAAANETDATEWASELTGWARRARNALSDTPSRALREDVLKAWKELGGPAALGTLDKLRRSLIASFDEIEKAVLKLKAQFEEAHKATKTELERRLQKEGVPPMARQRTLIRDQLKEAEADKRRYDAKLKELRGQLEARSQTVIRLSETLRRVTKERTAGAEELTKVLSSENGPQIGIHVKGGADVLAQDKWLRESFREAKVHPSRYSKVTDGLVSAFGREGLVSGLLEGKLDKCNLGEVEQQIRDGLVPFETGAGSGALRVRPHVLSRALEGDQHYIDDVVEVTLDGRPITDLSPGQRCSALLPIILTGSTAPLILDQPEDNLDNQLVTGLLIRTLEQLKQHRQVIVVTHNPNIVVNGDAEQVVVMESSDGRCSCLHQASIDDEDVMKSIVGIMEGGREALFNRYKRYKQHVELPDFLKA